MAIRIPILTSFDPKGLKQANAQLGKLQGSVNSLGRNFAVAGAALAGVGAVIAKNVQSLARIDRITAQTEAVLKSTGTTANGTAKDIENLAGSLEALTATEAETIQEGANLLLTFKNIQNQAGAGNDIFNQTTAAMVDVARAMGTSAATEAIRLGKALNDPVKGIAALSRVGIQFTADQKATIKALQDSGDLMGAQKIILAELQSQFGGSGAAYAKTFSGQLELMGHELGTIGEEATMAVMPALQEMVGQLRELIPIIGPQLKAAIESVDWKALVQSVVDLTRFLVENGATIAKVVVGLFALNTAYKLMQVGIGLVNVGLALKTWWLAKVASGMTATTIATGAATGALKLFRLALITTGIGAFVVALGFIIEGATELDSTYRQTTPTVTSFGTEVLKTGHDAEWAAGKYGVLKDSLNALPKDVKINLELESSSRNTALNNYLGFLGGRAAEANPVVVNTGGGGGGGGGGATATTSPLNQLIADSKKNATIVKKQSTLERKGLSAEVAQWITTSNKPVKAANQAIQRITKNGNKAIANLTKAYTNSAAGQAAAAASAASTITQEFTAAYDDTADREAAALAERERVYQSFQDSVKNTFAGIKNAIVGAFDITELGGSTNAITRNMDKLLVRLRSFATNVSKLSGMGLNPALLQQVISAGPLAGARLAESLVMGGTGALAAINAGYNEFGVLSSQIATTGTESLFNQASQQSIYNINVDGGVGSGATIGKAIVDAIKAYERTSGAVWQGA